MKRRDEIKKNGRLLFNEQGLETITTRHIAAEMNISQGNLHYHFPNKNELISELYEDFKRGLVERAKYQAGSFGLKEIYQSLQDNFELMYEYRFLFLDREILWRRLPTIKRETQALIIIKSRQLRAAIQKLQEVGLFRTDVDEKQSQSFITMYQLMINSWLSAVYLFHSHEPVAFFSEQAFRAWYPYLTDIGKYDFRSILTRSTDLV